MNNFAKKIGRGFGSKKGFSLIEMLVAMAIFMLFTGVLLTSYLGIVKALRNTEDYRILYSEARHVFDVITDVARNYKINYYDDYGGSRYSVNPVSNLEFLSLDGLKKIDFEYKNGAGDVADSLVMSEFVRDSVDGGFDLANEVGLYSDEITIENFSFYVWPLKDPFAYDDFQIANNFQPKVTFSAIFEKESSGGQKYKMKLQTSVSLRNYN